MALGYNFITNNGVFAFRKVKCNAEGCVVYSKMNMGHLQCAEHSTCRNYRQDECRYVYEPDKCDHCITFLRENLVGATVLDQIKSASAEWETHLKKLRRSLEGLEGDQHLEFLPGIGNLRKKCRSKSIDVGYFRDLDILELCREEQQVEYPSSQTSGTEVPRPGKPESPDKSTKEEVAALKGQVARIEDALMKFLDLQA